ncbi:hypothetical protein [Flavobacterium olei]|uniref:hypothetical protein n=1 Tax=Flavobacterium olei TaxID=1886782 RepID=UPI003219BDE8
MKDDLLKSVLDINFPEIDGVLLFGSYIKNPSKANDVDLLLISDGFLYSSKELIIYKGKKFNVIKFASSEVSSILANIFMQGDFYKVVFQEGIVLSDKKKDIQFIRQFIIKDYPHHIKDILAVSLNETSFRLAEYQQTLENYLSEIEFFMISSKIIYHLIDWFLLTNGIHHVKADNKFKATFFEKKFPVENKKILKLINSPKNYDQKKFLQSYKNIADEYLIPFRDHYSNDLSFDNYNQPSLILYIEKLFSFSDLKDIIDKIKSMDNSIEFFIYQVDEENQEKSGCYIVYNNTEANIQKKREKWLSYFNKQFLDYNYIFPFNNIYYYPEIKFLGRINEKKINQILIECINLIHENELPKENYLICFLENYLTQTNLKIKDLYDFYLMKLNAKRRSSSYFEQKKSKIESDFLTSNIKNEKKLLRHLAEFPKINLYVKFEIVTNMPNWFHFQVVDRLISLLLKNDSEKLFYIHCLKKINEKIS